MILRLALPYFHPWPNDAGFYVARALGRYAAHGLEPDIGVVDPERGDSLAALARGDVDLAVFPTNRLFVRREQGARVVALAVINHVGLDTVQALPERGISRPRDLAGRRVAYNPTPRGRALLRRIVARDGGDPDGIVTVDAGLREYALADLLRHDVADATFGGYWAWDALFCTLPDARRLLWRADAAAGLAYHSYLLGTHEDRVARRPDMLRRFLAATADGFAAAAADPSLALACLERVVAYFPRAILARSLALVAPTWTDRDGVWGTLDPAKLAGYAAWLGEVGILADAAAWPHAVDASFLPATAMPA